jgi:hypothetical protein
MKPNWIIGQKEIDLARKRLADVGRQGTAKGALGVKGIWKILSTWEIWVFTFVYSCYIFSQSQYFSVALLTAWLTGLIRLFGRSATGNVVLVEIL